MNAQEFKQRFMPFHKLLYRVAFHLTGNVQDAEDLLQDTYLKLWQKRDDIREEAVNQAYLVTLMRNLLRDQQRLKHIDSSAELRNELSPPDERSLEGQIAARDEASQMKNLINQLPKRDKEIIRMHLMEERTYDEIEQDTGLSQGNIRIIVMRTKQKLKQQFIKLTKTWTN
ncbi:MAG: RNA polymerase sigma factor [Bacteroidaceae bacterium]|nr:RNA polymerase sigma factor [Bacteroidaceae bacterium]MBR1901508.1 RNA polymerase sigma factor [Bacteroidaceae bacterium]